MKLKLTVSTVCGLHKCMQHRQNEETNAFQFWLDYSRYWCCGARIPEGNEYVPQPLSSVWDVYRDISLLSTFWHLDMNVVCVRVLLYPNSWVYDSRIPLPSVTLRKLGCNFNVDQVVDEFCICNAFISHTRYGQIMSSHQQTTAQMLSARYWL